MSDETRRASLIVVATGILWGLYWMPVRALSGAGLGGAWGTLAIVAAAALCLAPLVLARRRLSGLDTGGVAATALGGAAFVLYSVGLVHGRVAVIILLFFLTPVWSVLIGRALGWPTRHCALPPSPWDSPVSRSCSAGRGRCRCRAARANGWRLPRG
ncbi:hypothetical protein LVO79_06140 [Roseivivax marinus]|uniref:hypothetical protein n=1 Tax=Roseivivax marinus TaxID=1379903 RepID=UPI001F035878|nr:hypothetical protein [Roseivivax marinus]UMA66023.1 hypothetical protein LVO79_06140 [Roseivivax marinus]